MHAVEASGLVKTFGQTIAVDNLSLTIPRGVCFGLLGPNGAGKTTTIRMIQTVSPPTRGSLRVLGMDAADGRMVRQHLGVVPQEDNLDPDFTVQANLEIYARFFGIPKDKARTRAKELLAFLNLEEKADARIDELSGGMKRRLVVARALVHDPDLLVLDEPTTGLDPQARHALWDTIRKLRRSGKTILLTTHYMDEAEILCDALVVIDKGTILEQGKPKDLVAKHCGKEALELVADDEVLDAVAEDVADAHERLPDRIIVYGDDLEGEQLRLRDAHKLTETVLRRATLEDVFLRLTGRALRE